MKKRRFFSAVPQILSSLLIVGAFAAPAFAADTMAGTWAIASTGIAPVCTFTLKGKVLSGDCKGPVNQGAISGSVDGKNVKWTWNAKNPQYPMVIEFTGQWDLKDAVSGKWQAKTLPPGAQDPGAMDFTATRQAAK